jgi:hypothetical protein
MGAACPTFSILPPQRPPHPHICDKVSWILTKLPAHDQKKSSPEKNNDSSLDHENDDVITNSVEKPLPRHDLRGPAKPGLIKYNPTDAKPSLPVFR